MLAGSEDTILLLIGALVVVGGLVTGYALTRPKTALEQPQTPEPKVATPETKSSTASDSTPQQIPHAVEPTETVSIPKERPALPTDKATDVEEPIAHELDNRLSTLDPQLKHRIIYRFMPHLKGMLFEGETLDGYLADAIERAGQRGWGIEELLTSASSGKWKKPRAKEQDA